MNTLPSLISLAEDALADEALAIEIYSTAARMSRDENTRRKLLEIAEMERRHLNFWRSFLEKRGAGYRIRVSPLKVRLHTILIRILGLALAFKVMESGERDAIKMYAMMLEHSDMAGDEREKLKEIFVEELLHEHELSEEESRFTEFLSHVRDMVLGMNDGLVEILSVTAGLAGAYGDPFTVGLSGLVVAIAGSLSMGIGAYAAAKSQKQVHEGVLGRVRLAARYTSQLFMKRIRSLMIKKGYREETADLIAGEVARDPSLLARTIAEEEHGLREEAIEKPASAGLYTGIAYFISSLIPVTPYMLGLPILASLLLSIVAAGAALAIIGFIIAISANLPIKRKILEMMLAGFGSAAATYALGRIFSAVFGISVE
ncbi:MAG: VIT1/CCC1 transporter family protein [Thaumarchaeota archaeon]|jgi:VIT1/CCC1 family predicted Fe2+/Mn2+ transporter|nr:VIT1/CCC1 transporter family protein [Candidatus Wolframiiraptor allenii]